MESLAGEHQVTHLCQRALHWSQEVGLPQAVVVAVDVVQLEAQTLHLFKIKVQSENLGVGGVYTAANHLRPIHLRETQRTEQRDEIFHFEETERNSNFRPRGLVPEWVASHDSSPRPPLRGRPGSSPAFTPTPTNCTEGVNAQGYRSAGLRLGDWIKNRTVFFIPSEAAAQYETQWRFKSENIWPTK